MRKKLVVLLFVLAAVAGAGALATKVQASTDRCPRGSHLIVCPTYSFCCPNNAFCACL